MGVAKTIGPILLVLGCCAVKDVHGYSVEKIYYNTIKVMQANPEDFPLFPTSEDAKKVDLPQAIDPHETDLEIIRGYYEKVAGAFEKHATQKNKEVQILYSDLTHNQQRYMVDRWRKDEKSHLSRQYLRRDDYGVQDYDRSTEGVRIKAIQYADTTYKDLVRESQKAAQQAQFYQAMAETCQEVKENLKN